MRILYISKETPMTPRGGIGTYLGYIVPAMRAAGHEVYLFTWHDGADLQPQDSPFSLECTRIKRLSTAQVARASIWAAAEESLASALLPDLIQCIEEWQIDVIEATDYLSPATALFSYLKSRTAHQHRLCVTYHHGFIEDFFEHDHLQPPPNRQNELSGERQQCRMSDLVIAPSEAALRNLRSYGIFTAAQVIREPYRFGPDCEIPALLSEITYMGRMCLAKGMDKFIYLANAIHARWPILQITCVGAEVPTPFRIHDTRQYICKRLSPDLSTRVRFYGHIPREEALGLLVPGQMAPHLGAADTFSYACIESIDHGLLPLVREGTPMAEFFPDHLRHLVFPESLGTPVQIQQHFESLIAAGPELVHQLREYNIEVLAPDNIASQMGDAYVHHLALKQNPARLRPRATCEDVTILIPAYKPDIRMTETIDSIAAQTAGQPRVIICDDGSPAASLVWFDYARLRLQNFKIVRQPNGGLLAARNTLVEHLETPLAIFLDTDDLLTKEYLERVLETYNLSPTANAVITERWNFEEGNERIIRHYMGDHLHFVRNDYRMTALIESAALQQVTFDQLRRNGEADDWVFWLRFQAHGYQVALLAEPLFRYRFHTDSMSWPWSIGQSNGTNTMLKDAMTELVRLRPDLVPQVARAFSLIRKFG